MADGDLTTGMLSARAFAHCEVTIITQDRHSNQHIRGSLSQSAWDG
jgi:hypothetical protein